MQRAWAQASSETVTVCRDLEQVLCTQLLCSICAHKGCERTSELKGKRAISKVSCIVWYYKRGMHAQIVIYASTATRDHEENTSTIFVK